MREERISRRQLFVLLWAGTLAPAAERLSPELFETAGRSGWLSLVVTGVLLWGAGGLAAGCAVKYGGARLLREGFGPIAGRGILLIYMVWGVILLALRLALCAGRLLDAGYRDGSDWFFLTVLAGLTTWIGMGKRAAFARTGQIFLAILLTAAAAVLLLAVGTVRPERILPLWSGDIPYIIKGMAPAVGALGWGVYVLFLCRGGEEETGGGWTLRWLGGCLLLAAAQVVIQGNLGVELAQRVQNPFFALAKRVGVKGAFQRIEALIGALWCLSDLVMAGVLVFALREMTASVWEKRQNVSWVGGAAVAVAWLLALVLAPTAERWDSAVCPAVHLALCATTPGLFLLAAVRCGKKCGKKHILWWKKG